ncbi:MAG: hypothetical protein JWO53_908, partial [Chlamydiia bacterium]|nr:hypothetical protein [Chlamydiia bacterium]
MTQLVSDSTLIQMLSNQLFFAHRYESEYCLNKEFKAVRRQEGISSPSSEAVVDRVFKCVKKVCSESAVKAIESKKWATLQANLEQYCKTQKDFNPDSKLYEKVSKILKQRVETTRTSKEFFEHILGKNEKELTSSDAIFLQEVATTLEYEKSFFEALFLQTNQELRLLECKKAMEAAGIIICAPANAQSSTGDITYQYEFVGSERGSLTAHLFMKRFRSFSNKKRTLLPKEQFFEVLELMQSNDKDIKQIATQFFEFSRHRYAHEMQNRHIKMAVQSVAKKAVAIRSFKEQFYAFCPYLFPLIEAVIKASLKAAKEA